MATKFNLSVVAPDRTVVDEEVTSVIVPAYDGYMGVQHGHQPMIVALRAGVFEYRDATEQKQYVAIGGGFMEIGGDRVIVLADEARLASEVQVRETERELDEARKALRGEPSTMTTDEATSAIERATARLQAARNGGYQ
ncbi:MAG: ATP synthase F1 subunit epsilon [Chthonomonas sp.]|nr:ATP synthase F1 subunit epsilon [Chthonomonas sp.]